MGHFYRRYVLDPSHGGEMHQRKKEVRTSGAAAFRWWKPEAGFKWVPGRLYGVAVAAAEAQLNEEEFIADPRNNWLVPVKTVDCLQWASPMEAHPDLHRQFAEVEPSADSMLEFANEHGPLLSARVPYSGFRPLLDVVSDEEKSEISGISRFGQPKNTNGINCALLTGAELQHLWIREIHRMRDCIWTWDTLGGLRDEPDLPALKQAIVWRGRGVYFQPPRRREEASRIWPGRIPVREDWRTLAFAQLDLESWIASKGFADQYLDEWQAQRDVLGPALQFVMLSVNRLLRSQVSPSLRLSRSGDCTFSLESDRAPHSLLGALWLLFHNEITGETQLRMCPVCGKSYVAVDPRMRHCRRSGSGCRKKAHRIRSIVLGGASPEEVSTRYGIPLARIRRILEAGRRTSGGCGSHET